MSEPYSILQKLRDTADPERLVELGEQLDELCEHYGNGEVVVVLLGKLTLMARGLPNKDLQDLYFNAVAASLRVKLPEGGHRQ